MIKFELPEMEVVKFEMMDVITTSNECPEFDCDFASDLG